MNNKFCGYVPFKDEQNWWLNLQDLVLVSLPNHARNLATCCGCGREFLESDLDEQSGLCGDCDRRECLWHDRKLDDAIVIVEVDECCTDEWCERRAKVEAWLSARGM